MLLGEHAVLHDELAIVCAIAQRMRVKLTPISSRIVSIRSALGEYQSFIDQIEAKAPFQFVLTAINQFTGKLKTGFILEIQAEFSAQIGFASSAAVTVATLAAMHLWLHDAALPPLALFNLAKTVILAVQGRGSGADVAACVYGGTLAYRVAPFSITQLQNNPLITAVYSGSKTPTAQVIASVDAARERDPTQFKQLFTAIGNCSEQAAAAIDRGDWPALGNAMRCNQTLMAALGVNNASLQLIVDTLQAQDAVYAAKISGSGLGDCVVGLLKASEFRYPINAEQRKLAVQAIPVTISPEGLCYE